MKNKHFACWAIASFLAAAPLFAQDVEWEKLGGLPGGGHAAGLFEDGQGHIFCLHEPNSGGQNLEVFRSLDGGLTWAGTALPNLQGTIWNHGLFGSDGAIYVQGQAPSWKTPLYRSTDGGNSFQAVNPDVQDYNSIDLVLPTGTVLSGGYHQVLRSTDWGNNWDASPMPTVGNSNDLRLFYDVPTQKTYALAKSYSSSGSNIDTLRIFESGDDGLTWGLFLERAAPDVAYNAWAARAPNGIFFIGLSENTLLRSTDGGATWDETDLTGTTNHNWEFPNQFSAMPNGELLIMVGYVPFSSPDNGASWQPRMDFSPYDGYYGLTGIKAMPSGLLFASGTSLYRSADGGQSWQFASTGITHGAPSDIAFKNTQEFYAATPDGPFRTTDGGINWTLLEDKHNQKYLLDIELNAAGDLFYSNGTSLFRRLNGASSADSLPVALAGLYQGEQLTISPDGQIFANLNDPVTGYTTARSTDNGNTWQPIALPGYDFTQMKFAPGGKMMLSSWGGILRSEDNGATWESLNFGNNFYSEFIESPSPGEIWVLGSMVTNDGPAILKSGDWLQTWDSTEVDPTTGIFWHLNLVAPTVNQAGHIFSAGFGSVVVRSVDGGLTFNELPEVLPDYSGNIQGLFLSPDQKLYVSDWTEGLFRTKAPTTDATLMTGKVLHDVDENCLAALPDSVLTGIKLTLRKNGSGNSIFATSDGTGKYTAPVSVGQFLVKPIPPSKYWAGCTTIAQVSVADLGGMVDSADAALRPLQHCPLLTVDLQAGFLRRCFDGSYFVYFKNKGTEPANGAFVEVTLDPFLVFIGATIPLTSQAGNVLRFDLGQVGIGKKGSFRIDFTISCDAPLGEIHCSEANIFPNQHCPAWGGGQLRAFSDCAGSGGTGRLFLKNIGPGDMQMPADWGLAEYDGNFYDTLVSFQKGSTQLAAGQIFEKTVPNNGHLFALWAGQEAGFPLEYAQTWTAIKGCGSADGPTGWIWQNAPFFSSSCQSNNGSWDPNDKSAQPEGIGPDHRIDRGQPLEYLVRFQNTGTDTAFNVVVRDTLSAFLDAASIEPGASGHPYRFELLGEGEAVFYFNNIQLPDSNINEAASHGFVKFRIAQRPGLADDLIIGNRAAIFFDFNAPVLTNTVERTIGLPNPPAVGTGENGAYGFELDIQPNPAGAEFEVRFSAKRDFEKTACLTDALGKMLREEGFAGETIRFERGDLPGGLYFVLIKNGSGEVVAARRLVLR